MADLLFTIGADDRDFRRTMDRLDRTSAVTAHNVAKIFKVGSFVAVGTRSINFLTDAVREYAETSEGARRRVEEMTAPWRTLKAAIGEATVDALVPFLRYLQEAAQWWDELITGGANGFMPFGDEATEAQRIHREQEARAKAVQEGRRIRGSAEADILDAAGDRFGAGRSRENAEHERRLREIGALTGLANEEKDRLRTWENARHDAASRRNQADEAKDIRDKWVQERREQRFNSLELNTVADRNTRLQVIGASGHGVDFQAEQRRLAREQLKQGRDTVDVLKKIEANTAATGGASFQ